MAAEHDPQRIARLTPVAEVMARIAALVGSVAPCRIATAAAVGRVLAENVIAAAAVPTGARALHDGFAVLAETVSDASAYAPVPLAPPQRVDAGDVLPQGADAVAPLDIVVEQSGGVVAIAPVAPGEGVLAAGADVGGGVVLRRAGEVVRAADRAAFAVAGIAEVAVREPRICVAPARAGNDAVVAAAADLIDAAIAAAGGRSRRTAGDLPSVFADQDVDAIIVIGGTGRGRNDASVRALAAAGRVDVHGVALMPGETAAFGMLGPRPVLLMPGRLDAALAVWLTLGRHLLARLASLADDAPGRTAVLARKHASPLGLTELVPVRTNDGQAEPIASGYWPVQALGQANGWILVPSDSEGYPAGSEVVVRPWV
jgi:molybdopterin biosynthesis enzyme